MRLLGLIKLKNALLSCHNQNLHISFIGKYMKFLLILFFCSKGCESLWDKAWYIQVLVWFLRHKCWCWTELKSVIYFFCANNILRTHFIKNEPSSGFSNSPSKHVWCFYIFHIVLWRYTSKEREKSSLLQNTWNAVPQIGY